MNHNRAFQESFNQTLLGLIIGWGGFSTLMPNTLEFLSTIFDLGSFRALRIFSIAFFLLPIFSFLIYWSLRGSRLTFKYISNREHRINTIHFSVILFGTILTALPVLFFINDQFFLDGLRIGVFQPFKKAHHLLIWYTLLACGFLFYTSRIQVKYSLNKGSSAPFETSSFFVYFLFLLFGIGVISYIEPWVIYKSEINYFIVRCSLFYLLFGLTLYLVSKKEKYLFTNYKRFSYGSMGFLLIVSCYPSLTYSVEYSDNVSIIYGSYAILLFVSPVIKRIAKKGKDPSLGALLKFALELLIIFLVFWAVQNTLMKGWMKKANIAYYNSRVEALNKVSNKKIFPLIHFEDPILKVSIPKAAKEEVDKRLTKKQLDTISEKFADGLKLANYKDSLINREKARLMILFADTIYSLNHKIVDVLNNRSADSASLKLDFPGLKPKMLYRYSEKNKNEYGVRAFYFRTYFKRNGELKLEKPENLADFYNRQYVYIEDTIINVYLKPATKLGETYDDLSFKNQIENYYHPINYFTKTLQHYKEQVSIAEKLNNLSKEYAWIDSLSTTDKKMFQSKRLELKNKVWECLDDISELNNEEFLEVRRNSEGKISSYPGVDKLLGIDKLSKKKDSNLFPYILHLKNQQYVERFKRAQHIFKAYLQDSQRIGLYLLVSTLAVLLIIYWLFYRIDEPEVDKKSLDELPGGYLNMAILIFTILFIHMARPIKPENINPEQPHWMMNLDNWYEKNAIRKFFGAEDEASKTINSYRRNDIEKLLNEASESNRLLQEIEKNLK